MSDSTTKRLQYLEEKSAYQERLLDDLNEVIIEQQAQLNQIEERLHRLVSELNAMRHGTPDISDVPPPHY
jgi:SlyX protein